ncbi:hypothetical protein AQUCO_04300014v1 [Aquilegia coerulea]|uniref:RING-type domain-containing protein n=2 Tax=Aquilegia coerulea TaxID=218851 RepID=A0A2G5CNA2_AQUCA|nr:hypothetical protein AQUCO_04300014v1 [Aquilegia coerulea]
MSISPIHAQRSASSSSSSSLTLSSNPTSNHGFLLQPSSSSSQQQQLVASSSGSLPISVSDHPVPISDATVSSAADTGGFTNKVTDTRRPNGQKSTRRQYNGNHFQNHSSGRGRTSYQLRNDQVESAQQAGQLSEALDYPQNQPTSSAAHSTTRKNQSTNANHLLNFRYDRISRSQSRIPPPPRRQQKIRPYNKDLFLQANYRFVLLDSGNYSVESIDADKMLQWEDVVCVRYSTPHPVQCPICLETPLCPQITSCGHIFCFPCILRYLSMGDEDHKGDCWKKCPLCFLMISLKDLYTIYIETVKHYQLGDIIQFTLLTRLKSSLLPSLKNEHDRGDTDSDSVDLCDNFSKFTLTSNVELSVGDAYSELKDWLARAEAGLVDDLQQLPYVCAALEELEKRKRFWTEMRSLISSPPIENSSAPNIKACEHSWKIESHLYSSVANDAIDSEVLHPIPTPCVVDNKSKCIGSKTTEKLDVVELVTEIGELFETSEGEEKLSSSYEDENLLQRHSNGFKQIKEKDSYFFYQAVDGQHLILHPLNMKCLLHHFGSYDLLPPRISGKILQLETVTQTEDMRRRYRFLSHFSLTTSFQLCEIDMSEVLPSDALLPFMDEIKKRENQRKRFIKKEQQEKIRAEAALIHTMPISYNFGYSSIQKSFSMDEFEALGNAPLPSTPPMTSERKRFSDVARLGFASAHDSPLLKAEESTNVSSTTEERGEASGPRSVVTMSFANIMSTSRSSESGETQKMDALVGKKGKKPSRVLLSTAGGRRY